MNTPNHGIDYTNGQQHEVRMWRTGENGQMVHLQVRERERERERERDRQRERVRGEREKMDRWSIYR